MTAEMNTRTGEVIVRMSAEEAAAVLANAGDWADDLVAALEAAEENNL